MCVAFFLPRVSSRNVAAQDSVHPDKSDTLGPEAVESSTREPSVCAQV